MRPAQNRRMRNRNRKAPNPLTKTFESNGPDVKVRGTAQHIAEKYVQLARDAHASGNPVTAENYLQHAEHYLRIILTAQAQYQQSYGLPRSIEDEQDEADEENGFDYGVHSYGAPQPEARFSAHDEENQPVVRQRERTERHARNHDRFDRPERMDRPERNDRPERMDRRDRFRRRRDEVSGFSHAGSDNDSVHQSSLPAFLTTPVRTVSDNEEQPSHSMAQVPSFEHAEAPRRASPILPEDSEFSAEDKPAPRVRRRRAPTSETPVEVSTESSPTRKIRTTRTRRKVVDDVPVAE